MVNLVISDPVYTDRLVSFLESVGQTVVVEEPGVVMVARSDYPGERAELDIYLRVWNVLYPTTQVSQVD